MPQLMLLRRKAVAQLLNIHPITLDRLLKRGKLQLSVVQIGQLKMFKESEVMALINSEKVK